METEARVLNPGFVSRMTRGRPWVRLKTASTLDGKIALANGASQWITGEAARADVQRLRARACAVLTGSGTVLADNPRMKRDVDIGRQPLRSSSTPLAHTKTRRSCPRSSPATTPSPARAPHSNRQVRR
jgi:diaminohydroxyphosphoribosylaminopyrimidine deaminase/5-amino-6-(5-phosphoribosylamino)uracil reductase